MSAPRILVTGASGFAGRRLIDALKERFRVIGIARRSQVRSGAPVHPAISWHQVDIGEREPLATVFRHVASDGPVEAVIHLAAHYDFSGEEHPEYWRTNVQGLRHVLELCRTQLTPRLFVFASSVAACDFPPPGRALNESSPPDGDHVYARTKAVGERMLDEYRDAFPSVTVRFAALFSDWCEYPPLFMFLSTWLSRAWNNRILGGKGLSAIPYLHVRDAVLMLQRIVDKRSDLLHGEVLVASTNGAVSHRDLFDAATYYYFGTRQRPILMPKPLCGPGILARDFVGRLLGERPFERPWMARYVDKAMTVNAPRTRSRLGWSPRDRLEIVRRLPFLIENFRADPVKWHLRNEAAMKEVRVAVNLRIHRMLERHETRIVEDFCAIVRDPSRKRMFPTYHHFPAEQVRWNTQIFLRHLMNAVRTRDRAVLLDYCRDLAERRLEESFGREEVCTAVQELGRVCLKTLREDPDSKGLEEEMQGQVAMTLMFGCDQVHETFERLTGSEFETLEMPNATSAGRADS
jgi:nucleoside-diphosphate-sugar epimerase